MDVSHDAIAHMWPDKSTSLTGFTDAATEENLQVCLRSRYFLEHLKCFLGRHSDARILLLGSGLASYPYLLENRGRWTEVDITPMVEYKRARATALIKAGQIRAADVTYLGADISRRDQLHGVMKDFLDGAKTPTMIVVEGLLYYLSEGIESEIFQLAATGQSRGDEFAFDFWPLEAAGNEIYQAWEQELRAESSDLGPVTRLSDPERLLRPPLYHLVDHYRHGEYAQHLDVSGFSTEAHIPTEFVTLRHE